MAKKIMIQGTMSNAGKSLICTGLARIFHQDGYQTAPFKSQNMALNSYITDEGLEMGRAQVVQAEAAGIAPSVDMNPILLKPSSDVGSQVIVRGKAIGNLSAKDYFAYKKQLIPQILSSLANLEAYDILVMEGAGSPAEINLKQEDIVNMGMAKMAKAPVLLVGDIDRGGVFAQILGTLMLLEEEERRMVKGLIINKFRGDKGILEPGIRFLEKKSKIPVVGVTPYLQVDIEEEDSLTERFFTETKKKPLDIAVIRVPRISNFTDFMPLENLPQASLRYVSRCRELKDPDLILLPGTKSTMADLRWLRESGLEVLIQKAAQREVPVWGICGGYQMLGETLEDPFGAEGGGSMKGMGLLPIRTVFSTEKTRTQVRGILKGATGILEQLNHTEIEGYEIHMGESVPIEDSGFLSLIENRITGEKKKEGYSKGNVYGTYVHGIFDREEVVRALLNGLAEKKGIRLEEEGYKDYKTYKEEQYDLLAAGLREHLDMKEIYRILEKGI